MNSYGVEANGGCAGIGIRGSFSQEHQQLQKVFVEHSAVLLESVYEHAEYELRLNTTERGDYGGLDGLARQEFETIADAYARNLDSRATYLV